MKKTVILGSLLAVFLVLSLPAVSATKIHLQQTQITRSTIAERTPDIFIRLLLWKVLENMVFFFYEQADVWYTRAEPYGMGEVKHPLCALVSILLLISAESLVRFMEVLYGLLMLGPMMMLYQILCDYLAGY